MLLICVPSNNIHSKMAVMARDTADCVGILLKIDCSLSGLPIRMISGLTNKILISHAWTNKTRQIVQCSGCVMQIFTHKSAEVRRCQSITMQESGLMILVCCMERAKITCR